MHPVKTIAMGEGGAIAVADARTAQRLRHLRSHGITRSPNDFVLADAAFDPSGVANPWHYEQTELGFNYRATEMQCALGVSQMKKLRRFTEHRRALRNRYVEGLASLQPVVRAVPEVSWCRPAWHLMVVLIDFPAIGRTRAEVMRALSAAGVGTQVHYIPIHRQPYYRARYGEITLPGAESYFSRCLSLPLHAGMISEDVDAVVDALAEVVGVAADI
jgi:dTDP-4-amino-4,6-dideoxygalactose transaminase